MTESVQRKRKGNEQKACQNLILRKEKMPLSKDCVSNIVDTQLFQDQTAGVLCRFTVSTDPDLQLKAAGADVISILVRVLQSDTPLAKCRAAISLEQFSQNSGNLSPPVKKKQGFLCFSPSSVRRCRVHRGVCSD